MCRCRGLLWFGSRRLALHGFEFDFSPFEISLATFALGADAVLLTHADDL